MIRSALLASSLALAAGGSLAAAAESAYTEVDLNHCETISKPADVEAGDFVSLKCKGYGTYPLYFKEGDVRQTVFFGPIAADILDGGFETFGPFNHIGRKVEWRLDAAGKPYAAILRFHIENPDPATGMPDKAHAGQVLVISRVAQPNDPRGCVVGYVDALANPEPNILARKVADEQASSFACGKDKAIFHGVRGDKAGDPTSSFSIAGETAE